VIKLLKRSGVYLKDIAEELGVHPKTISRALKRGVAPNKMRKQRGSKLLSHQDCIAVVNTDHIVKKIQVLDRRNELVRPSPFQIRKAHPKVLLHPSDPVCRSLQ